MTCPPQSDSQNLPVGWRFHPSDEELVDYYLKRKRLGHPIYGLDISEVQVCDYDPRDLPGLSMNNSRDKVWYFFCLRLYHNNRGQAKRKAKDGYWKGTGDLRSVTPEDSDEEIGTKRTLVFHNPKATQWVIHEYEYTAALNLPTKGDYVLCKLKISKNKKKASKKDEKAEPDSKKTRPNKKSRKSESNGNLASASASTSKNRKLEGMTTNSAYGEGEPNSLMILDLENQNLNTMASISTYNKDEMSSLMTSNFENGYYKRAIVSTCNKGETSCPMASDLENHCPEEMTAMSSYKKVNPSCPRASVLENLSPNEITSLSTNSKGDTSFFRTCDIENKKSDAFAKVKSIDLVTWDFEKQNPTKNIDIPVPTEGEQIPQSPSVASNAGETTCQEVQSQYKKTSVPIPEDYAGSSTTSNEEAMFQVQSQYKNTEMPILKDNGDLFTAFDAEAKFPEINSQMLEELLAFYELEDSLNSAPQQPIPEESPSIK
ncbi:protein NTM1-like 9 isoform X2 [Manihot esculenta]|nr:protein NTM1-like 9 isoform X2 [Manihot esculenta]